MISTMNLSFLIPSLQLLEGMPWNILSPLFVAGVLIGIWRAMYVRMRDAS